jgi:hypothetical protein
MFISCWSVKGGAGTTIVAAALALGLARRAGRALAVDLAGDLPTTFGMAEPVGPGVSDWCAVGERAPADGLARCELPVTADVALLWRGAGRLGPEANGSLLAEQLRGGSAPAVVDAGLVGAAGADHADEAMRCRVVVAADVSLLVIRPCYVSLRRAMAGLVRPTAVVVIDEPGRSLNARDVRDVLGVPVLAELMVDPCVGRATDAGLLASRLPRALTRALAPVLDELVGVVPPLPDANRAGSLAEPPASEISR